MDRLRDAGASGIITCCWMVGSNTEVTEFRQTIASQSCQSVVKQWRRQHPYADAV